MRATYKMLINCHQYRISEMRLCGRVLKDLLNIVGVACNSNSKSKSRSTCQVGPELPNQLEKSLDQFSESCQQPLSYAERRVIRDFELETTRARIAGCGARLLFPAKGVNIRSSPQNFCWLKPFFGHLSHACFDSEEGCCFPGWE